MSKTPTPEPTMTLNATSSCASVKDVRKLAMQSTMVLNTSDLVPHTVIAVFMDHWTSAVDSSHVVNLFSLPTKRRLE